MRHAPFIIWCLIAAAPLGCRRDAHNTPARRPAHPQPMFVEVTDAWGVDFVHETGCTFTFLYPEIMGSGLAVFDYDADGRRDIYLINGAPHPPTGPAGPPPVNRLLRRGADGVYHDVSHASGLDDRGYGMGVAVGDIDNDGDADVYVTNVGPNALYRNNGHGTFTDVTTGALAADAWSTSACFFDYDNDGFLDLYVTNYLRYDPSRHCRGSDGSPDYCGPQEFDGVHDVLYRGRGDGTFADVSRSAGIARSARKGLGVLCVDVNRDARPDVYVANDGEPNQLWINRGDGTFVDEAMTWGVAVNEAGRTEGGMGVAAGDVNGDGAVDLFVTNLWKESHTLYVSDVGGADPSTGYADRTTAAGLDRATAPLTGFGTAMFDFDHDGDLDILAVNGRVFRDDPYPGAGGALFWTFYAEPNLLFENDGSGRFHDVCVACGPLCTSIEVSRGLVTADLDDDGDLDVVITGGGGRARVYRNDAPKRGHWLIVRAVDPGLSRDAIGARVTVLAGGVTQHRTVSRTYSYLCSGDARTHFGLGSAATIDQLSVLWPGGPQERFTPPPVDTRVTLTRGLGKQNPP